MRNLDFINYEIIFIGKRETFVFENDYKFDNFDIV